MSVLHRRARLTRELYFDELLILIHHVYVYIQFMGGLHVCIHSCVLNIEEYAIPHSLAKEPYERDDILQKSPMK